MEPLRFLIYILVGLVLDWAFYSRLVGLLGAQSLTGSNNGYRAFLLPRLFLTIVGVTLVFCAGTGHDVLIPLALCGSALFFASTFSAVYRFYRGDDISG